MAARGHAGPTAGAAARKPAAKKPKPTTAKRKPAAKKKSTAARKTTTKKPTAKKRTAKKRKAPAKKPKPTTAKRKPAAKKKSTATKKTTTKKPSAKKKPATRATKRKAPAKKPTSISKKAIEKKLAAAKKALEKKATAAAQSLEKTVSTAGKSLEKTVTAASQTLKDTGQRLAAVSKSTPTKKPKASTGRPKRAAPKAAPVVRPPFKAYGGAKDYLFCSYSHRNTPEVFETLARLRKRRFRIWYDEGIEPGAEWPEVIGTAVNGCTTMLVFMSRHASESRNVRNEINLAYGVDKNLLVVFLEQTTLTDGLQLQLGTVQSINKYELGDRAFIEALVAGLGTELKAEDGDTVEADLRRASRARVA